VGKLAKTPELDNWVDALPAGLKARWNACIVYRAAVHMHQERGFPVGKSIASALNWARAIVATGHVKQWPGSGPVNGISVAQCAAALAIWEEMKAYARAHKGKG